MSAFGHAGFGSSNRRNQLRAQGQLDAYGDQVRQAMQPMSFEAYAPPASAINYSSSSTTTNNYGAPQTTNNTYNNQTQTGPAPAPSTTPYQAYVPPRPTNQPAPTGPVVNNRPPLTQYWDQATGGWSATPPGPAPTAAPPPAPAGPPATPGAAQPIPPTSTGTPYDAFTHQYMHGPTETPFTRAEYDAMPIEERHAYLNSRLDPRLSDAERQTFLFSYDTPGRMPTEKAFADINQKVAHRNNLAYAWGSAFKDFENLGYVDYKLKGARIAPLQYGNPFDRMQGVQSLTEDDVRYAAMLAAQRAVPANDYNGLPRLTPPEGYAIPWDSPITNQAEADRANAVAGLLASMGLTEFIPGGTTDRVGQPRWSRFTHLPVPGRNTAASPGTAQPIP